MRWAGPDGPGLDREGGGRGSSRNLWDHAKRVLSFPLPLNPPPRSNTAIVSERSSSPHLATLFSSDPFQAHCWIGKCYRDYHKTPLVKSFPIASLITVGVSSLVGFFLPWGLVTAIAKARGAAFWSLILASTAFVAALATRWKRDPYYHFYEDLQSIVGLAAFFFLMTWVGGRIIGWIVAGFVTERQGNSKKGRSDE